MRKVTVLLTLLAGAGMVLASGTAGTIDSSFGDGGVVKTAVGGTGAAFSVARQSTGEIIAVGTDVDTGKPWVVRRYDTDGSLDTGFGTVALAPGGAVDGMPTDVAVDSQDRILITGSVTIETTSGNGKKQKTTTQTEIAVVRLTSGGSLDTSFGDGGTVLLDAGTSPGGVSLQADGRIVVTGNTVARTGGGSHHNGGGSSSQAILLVRLNSNGTLDSNFGSSGIVVDDVTSGTDSVRGSDDVQFQSDGKIVLNGDSDGTRWFLRRYDADGTVDTTFGSGGSVRGTSSDYLWDMIVDADDRIVCVGYQGTGTPGVVDSLVMRYSPDGSVDTSFGSDGEWLSGAADREELHAIRELSDGKLAVGGMYWPLGGSTDVIDAITYRLNADGTSDTSYGSAGQGELSTPADETMDEVGLGEMVVDGDGNVLLAGRCLDGTSGYWFLARWLAN